MLNTWFEITSRFALRHRAKIGVARVGARHQDADCCDDSSQRVPAWRVDPRSNDFAYAMRIPSSNSAASQSVTYSRVCNRSCNSTPTMYTDGAENSHQTERPLTDTGTGA